MVREKVGVVILNYKVKDLVLKCLASLKKSQGTDLEIVVVDNNSNDGLEAEMKRYPDVSFIQTGENLGYSGGNNIGIKYVLSKNVDIVFVLNSDTEVDPGCIKAGVKVMKDFRAGIAAPKILFGDKKTIWFAGGWLDKANVLGFHRGVDEIDQGQYNKEEEIDNATGGAVFIKREVFKKIGFFDEQYFLYYEDSDFFYRAKKAGFKIIYAPQAVVYHYNAQSTGLGSPLQDYYITRNRMLFAHKFLSFRTQFALIREALINFYVPARRLALWDVIRGRFGRREF